MERYAKGFAEKDAICILNTLPSSAGPLKQEQQDQLLPIMESFMKRVGLSVEEMDNLNIIHVTGTKGKGSTCAFTEQILRSHGLRTGFYSSPHLVEVRERIRINGQPIERELFNKHFLQVFERLDETKDANDGAMPRYFFFFTLLAFRVFLEEKVDVAIIEVGIGGQYDCTNVIRRPWVCGVSSLGIDHTQMLGDTIEKIAWHKGGIFKPGVPAFTIKQPEEGMAVLRDRAKEIGCPLRVSPDLEDYQTDGGPLRLSLAGKHQRFNASLALQLSHTWLQRRSLTADKSFPSTTAEDTGELQVTPFRPSAIMVKGLAETVWPGRTQILNHGEVTYFLDGAHTMRSMQDCADWFNETSAQYERDARPVARVLVFNVSRGRDSAALLKLLVPCRFDFAVFCTNIPDSSSFNDTDLWNVNHSVEDMMTRCQENEKSWRRHNNVQEDSEEDSLSLVFPCILSALQWITQGRDPMVTDPPVKPSAEAKAAALRAAAEIHVLITGNIRIVGGALKVLESDSFWW